ncbi:hypothetical protein JOF36_003186 [Pseudonocardia parietis]|uniref:Uncharacterized protein n=1 Tax=Pseudonocardia parietis TaxID=570936 RepID=A0ABS4VU73_9PSEU|nr:hypothetical protein [Pseudonocardia parietis]
MSGLEPVERRPVHRTRGAYPSVISSSEPVADSTTIGGTIATAVFALGISDGDAGQERSHDSPAQALINLAITGLGSGAVMAAFPVLAATVTVIYVAGVGRRVSGATAPIDGAMLSQVPCDAWNQVVHGSR